MASGPVWAFQRKLMAPFFVWLTVGLYDPAVRELMGYTWSRRDEWLHRRFGDVVRLVFAFVLSRYRKHPRARAGWDRVTGRIPAELPLVDTCPRATCPRLTSATAQSTTAPTSDVDGQRVSGARR